MATYFHGNSEIQGGGDGLQTLILMNPGYVGYSDTQPQPPSQGNFVFLNSAAAGHSLNPPGLSHAPPLSQAQQFVGIPLHAAGAASQDPSSVHSQHDMSAIHGFIPRLQYNLYNPVEFTATRDSSRAQQGLSLTLSSQQPGYGPLRPEREVSSTAPVTTIISPTNGEDMRVSGGSSSSASGISNGVNGIQSVLLSSKYLKAAQELLDEVVNVGKDVKTGGSANGTGCQNKTGGDSSAVAVAGDGNGGGEEIAKRGAELSTVERQEIQMKKAKLVNMLDEVEQRYRQYHQQMQIVISWFEQAAGIGSAKTYTALALQTISKQFRCLKDAILGQIQVASKSLGEEDCLGGKIEGSRLKYVDNQIRQQKALQQLGMVQHNAWRPQRGLPERSVSVLRAWLFEHFLHPYPKDSDKHMLAKQTGLTRSQVSNWFINARVRLWKPMVEEMYMEEMKDQLEPNGTEEKTSKNEQKEDSAIKSNAPQEKRSHSSSENHERRSFKSKLDNPTSQSTATTHPGISIAGASSNSPTGILSIQNHPNFIRSSELESFTQGSPKKLRGNELLNATNNVHSMIMDAAAAANAKSAEANNNEHLAMKFGSDRQPSSRVGFTLMGAPTNFVGGFGSYPIGEIGRFGAEPFQAPYSGNGVSLTLGLPHCENLSISGNHHHQTFLPNQSIQLGRGVEIGDANEFGAINTPTFSHSAAASVYDNINMQSRKGFAAQLLPDFVT